MVAGIFGSGGGGHLRQKAMAGMLDSPWTGPCRREKEREEGESERKEEREVRRRAGEGLRPVRDIHVSPPLLLSTTTVALLLPFNSLSPLLWSYLSGQHRERWGIQSQRGRQLDSAADTDRPILSGAVMGGGEPSRSSTGGDKDKPPDSLFTSGCILPVSSFFLQPAWPFSCHVLGDAAYQAGEGEDQMR